MRTITFNVYTFDELSKVAQANAIERERDSVSSMLNEFDADDYREALGKIEDAFGIKVYDWCVGYPGTYSRWRFENGSRFDGLEDDPKFLMRYMNEVERFCRKGKFYSTSGHHDENGKYHYKYRYSRVMYEREYALTGTWAGEVTDKFTGHYGWEYVRNGSTIKDYINDMLYEFFKQWENDQWNNREDDTIAESLLVNEYEYTENGVRYLS